MFYHFHKHETNTPQNAFIFKFNALLCGNKNWLTIKKLLRIAFITQEKRRNEFCIYNIYTCVYTPFTLHTIVYVYDATYLESTVCALSVTYFIIFILNPLHMMIWYNVNGIYILLKCCNLPKKFFWFLNSNLQYFPYNVEKESAFFLKYGGYMYKNSHCSYTNLVVHIYYIIYGAFIPFIRIKRIPPPVLCNFIQK